MELKEKLISLFKLVKYFDSVNKTFDKITIESHGHNCFKITLIDVDKTIVKKLELTERRTYVLGSKINLFGVTEAFENFIVKTHRHKRNNLLICQDENLDKKAMQSSYVKNNYIGLFNISLEEICSLNKKFNNSYKNWLFGKPLEESFSIINVNKVDEKNEIKLVFGSLNVTITDEDLKDINSNIELKEKETEEKMINTLLKVFKLS